MARHAEGAAKRPCFAAAHLTHLVKTARLLESSEIDGAVEAARRVGFGNDDACGKAGLFDPCAAGAAGPRAGAVAKGGNADCGQRNTAKTRFRKCASPRS
jgi:hypothetical protein